LVEPKRASEGEDSLVDEDFGDSKRCLNRDRIISFFVHLFEDKEEYVVRKRKEGSWKLSELRSCQQSAEWVRLPLSSLQDIFTYLPGALPTLLPPASSFSRLLI